MRTALYVAGGISVWTIGGLLIGLPIGYPLLIVIGATTGMMVAAWRKPSTKRHLATEPGLCVPCATDRHTDGMPCPNGDCRCSRCSPFIGRYAPEDSPSYFHE